MPTRPDLAAYLDEPLVPADRWPAVAGALRLSPQQSAVVRLVAEAMKDKQVAAALGISTATVRMHLRHAFAHLGVEDRMELALLVFKVAARLGQPGHGDTLSKVM